MPTMTETESNITPHSEIVRIRPSSGWRAVNLGELWRYRELLYFLTLRDIKVRYKQTALGVAWAVLQPLLTMIVFSIMFGRLAKFSQMIPPEIPYSIYVLAALIPWQLFVYELTQSSLSLVVAQRMITKVYFPRLIIPVASVLAGLVDLVVSFGIIMVMMAYLGVVPGWQIVFLPLFVLLVILTALSVGLWMSALNVQYRDVRYTIPFLAQFWMFLSPIAYPSTLVPESYRVLYGLNPMAGVVDGFRWALLGTDPPSWGLLIVSTMVVAVFLVSGLYYFRRLERTFADLV